MSRWETHRGDEWWYRDHAIEAAAVLDHCAQPPVFRISAGPAGRGPLTAGLLLHLLRRTGEQLPGCVLACSLDVVTEALLRELARSGDVQWEVVDHPYSREARITTLS